MIRVLTVFVVMTASLGHAFLQATLAIGSLQLYNRVLLNLSRWRHQRINVYLFFKSACHAWFRHAYTRRTHVQIPGNTVQSAELKRQVCLTLA